MPRPTRITAALLGGLLVLATGGSASAGQPASAQWHLTNVLNEHSDGGNTILGPDHRMADGANGTFPTGHLLVVAPGSLSSRVWSATVADRTFGRAAWTVDFGGASVVVDLRFIVGSYAPATGTFTPAPGEAAEVGPTGTATFTPASTFTVAPGQRLGLRVWHPGGSPAPSALDVWNETGGPSPSVLSVG